MLGYLRFFLATLVLLTHTGIRFHDFNFGIAAVVSFYMLAGLVVCGLLSKMFPEGGPVYFRFYVERLLRIFPTYLFIFTLVCIFLIISQYGRTEFNLVKLINNILIIPINYFMIFDNWILTEPKSLIIPPAWSLGLELQAYVILPFIVYYKPVKIIVSIVSLLVFIAACLGIVNTNYAGYMLLPGVMFIFVLGTLIFKTYLNESELDKFDIYFPIITYITLIILLVILGIQNEFLVNYATDVIFGVLIGYPVIIYMVKSDRKMPLNALFGELSYGIFLSHSAAMWIIDHYALINIHTDQYYYNLLVFMISLLVSFVAVFAVDRNIKKIRFKLTKTIKS